MSERNDKINNRHKSFDAFSAKHQANALSSENINNSEEESVFGAVKNVLTYIKNSLIPSSIESTRKVEKEEKAEEAKEAAKQREKEEKANTEYIETQQRLAREAEEKRRENIEQYSQDIAGPNEADALAASFLYDPDNPEGKWKSVSATEDEEKEKRTVEGNVHKVVNKAGAMVPLGMSGKRHKKAKANDPQNNKFDEADAKSFNSNDAKRTEKEKVSGTDKKTGENIIITPKKGSKSSENTSRRIATDKTKYVEKGIALAQKSADNVKAQAKSIAKSASDYNEFEASGEVSDVESYTGVVKSQGKNIARNMIGLAVVNSIRSNDKELILGTAEKVLSKEQFAKFSENFSNAKTSNDFKELASMLRSSSKGQDTTKAIASLDKMSLVSGKGISVKGSGTNSAKSIATTALRSSLSAVNQNEAGEGYNKLKSVKDKFDTVSSPVTNRLEGHLKDLFNKVKQRNIKTAHGSTPTAEATPTGGAPTGPSPAGATPTTPTPTNPAPTGATPKITPKVGSKGRLKDFSKLKNLKHIRNIKNVAHFGKNAVIAGQNATAVGNVSAASSTAVASAAGVGATSTAAATTTGASIGATTAGTITTMTTVASAEAATPVAGWIAIVVEIVILILLCLAAAACCCCMFHASGEATNLVADSTGFYLNDKNEPVDDPNESFMADTMYLMDAYLTRNFNYICKRGVENMIAESIDSQDEHATIKKEYFSIDLGGGKLGKTTNTKVAFEGGKISVLEHADTEKMTVNGQDSSAPDRFRIISINGNAVNYESVNTGSDGFFNGGYIPTEAYRALVENGLAPTKYTRITYADAKSGLKIDQTNNNIIERYVYDTESRNTVFYTDIDHNIVPNISDIVMSYANETGSDNSDDTFKANVGIQTPFENAVFDNTKEIMSMANVAFGNNFQANMEKGSEAGDQSLDEYIASVRINTELKKEAVDAKQYMTYCYTLWLQSHYVFLPERDTNGHPILDKIKDIGRATYKLVTGKQPISVKDTQYAEKSGTEYFEEILKEDVQTMCLIGIVPFGEIKEEDLDDPGKINFIVPSNKLKYFPEQYHSGLYFMDSPDANPDHPGAIRAYSYRMYCSDCDCLSEFVRNDSGNYECIICHGGEITLAQINAIIDADDAKETSSRTNAVLAINHMPLSIQKNNSYSYAVLNTSNYTADLMNYRKDRVIMPAKLSVVNLYDESNNMRFFTEEVDANGSLADGNIKLSDYITTSKTPNYRRFVTPTKIAGREKSNDNSFIYNSRIEQTVLSGVFPDNDHSGDTIADCPYKETDEHGHVTYSCNLRGPKGGYCDEGHYIPPETYCENDDPPAWTEYYYEISPNYAADDFTHQLVLDTVFTDADVSNVLKQTIIGMTDIEDKFNHLFFKSFGTNTGIDVKESYNYSYPEYFSDYSVDSNNHVKSFTTEEISNDRTLLTDCGTQEAYAGSVYLNAKDAQRYPLKGNPEVFKNISLENASDKDEYEKYVTDNTPIGNSINVNNIKSETLNKLKTLANGRNSLIKCGYIDASGAMLDEFDPDTHESNAPLGEIPYIVSTKDIFEATQTKYCRFVYIGLNLTEWGDVEELDHIDGGYNAWTCEACGTLNAGGTDTCTGCGAAGGPGEAYGPSHESFNPRHITRLAKYKVEVKYVIPEEEFSGFYLCGGHTQVVIMPVVLSFTGSTNLFDLKMDDDYLKAFQMENTYVNEHVTDLNSIWDYENASDIDKPTIQLNRQAAVEAWAENWEYKYSDENYALNYDDLAEKSDKIAEELLALPENAVGNSDRYYNPTQSNLISQLYKDKEELYLKYKIGNNGGIGMDALARKIENEDYIYIMKCVEEELTEKGVKYDADVDTRTDMNEFNNRRNRVSRALDFVGKVSYSQASHDWRHQTAIPDFEDLCYKTDCNGFANAVMGIWVKYGYDDDGNLTKPAMYNVNLTSNRGDVGSGIDVSTNDGVAMHWPIVLNNTNDTTVPSENNTDPGTPSATPTVNPDYTADEPGEPAKEEDYIGGRPAAADGLPQNTVIATRNDYKKVKPGDLIFGHGHVMVYMFTEKASNAADDIIYYCDCTSTGGKLGPGGVEFAGKKRKDFMKYYYTFVNVDQDATEVQKGTLQHVPIETTSE